ncbi:MAG TPA: hypothetical protein VJZ00_13715 [Thermoanaerobaculia bacterium]|nr:hypothetical protein [Thermoanaerobaculia bacterium]
MATTKIMVVRHAEKPIEGAAGVEVDGTADAESLIVRGWQRAGALAVLFDPSRGELQDPSLATPACLYSAKFDASKHSKRPYETLVPLAAKLDLTIDDSYKKDDYATMLQDAASCDGVVLIAWQHDDIPSIGNILMGNETSVPQSWPGDRFDMVWVFDAQEGGGYTFTQVPQLLLAGDLSTPIGG